VCVGTCESASRDPSRAVVTTTDRFILTREARTPARTHMSQRLQKEQGNVRGDAVAGPQALREVAECEYYGTEAIIGDFPFAFRLSSFFRVFRIIVEREEGEKEEDNP